MDLPHETLTLILGEEATYDPTTETTPKFMNGKFGELLENDKKLKEQINVLSTKTPFSCTAKSGYKINNQNCYILNGIKYVNLQVSKTDNTVFTQTYHNVASLPFSSSTISELASMLMIGDMLIGSSVAASVNGTIRAKAIDANATVIYISGVIVE